MAIDQQVDNLIAAIIHPLTDTIFYVSLAETSRSVNINTTHIHSSTTNEFETRSNNFELIAKRNMISLQRANIEGSNPSSRTSILFLYFPLYSAK